MQTMQTHAMEAAMVTLSTLDGVASPSLQLARLRDGCILLKAKAGGSLRIKPNLSVDEQGGEGPWARFMPQHQPDGTVIFQ